MILCKLNAFNEADKFRDWRSKCCIFKTCYKIVHAETELLTEYSSQHENLWRKM